MGKLEIMLKWLWFVLMLAIGFMMGYFAKSWVYEDICLDLGGGKNPNGYPICVIEKGSL